MATHSSILAENIPWTEEPGGLQTKGAQRVWHDWAQTKSTEAENTLVAATEKGCKVDAMGEGGQQVQISDYKIS